MTENPGSGLPPAYPPIKVALGVFVGAAVMVLMGVQPILIGLYSDHLHLDLTQGGWVLAAEQFGGAAGALFGYWIATRMRWSHSIAAACVVAAGINVATAYAGGFGEIASARFISGLATTVAYTVAIYFLGHTSKPDRVYGILMIFTTLFFSADAVALPLLFEKFGYAVSLGSSALWFGAAFLAAMWLPGGPTTGAGTGAPRISNAAGRPIVAAAALAGAFLLELSIFAVWGFLERVGRGDGLSDEQIGFGIAIGVLGGIPGGLAPAMIGDRYGRISMIAASAVMLVGSYVALAGALHLTGYVVAVTVLNVGWVLGLIYYMSLTVAHDPDGRYTRLMAFSQMLAAGVGPACSALAMNNDRLTPIFVIASIAAVAGLILVVAADRIGAFSDRRTLDV